jgi:hypothetical protein
MRKDEQKFFSPFHFLYPSQFHVFDRKKTVIFKKTSYTIEI